MSLTVEGTFKNGRIEIPTVPPGASEGRVLVTFLSARPAGQPRRISFGQFAGEGESTEEDFVLAEWRGESL